MKRSHYCKNCKKLLFKGNCVEIEIICRGCKRENRITFIDDTSLLTYYLNDSRIGTDIK